MQAHTVEHTHIPSQTPASTHMMQKWYEPPYQKPIYPKSRETSGKAKMAEHEEVFALYNTYSTTLNVDLECNGVKI